jgi:hypothetical protein
MSLTLLIVSHRFYRFCLESKQTKKLISLVGLGSNFNAAAAAISLVLLDLTLS